jgi:hypothetical protein
MKRSEILIKLQRFYGIKHVMVEQGYISKDQFMDEVLQLVEELGMLPPPNPKEYDNVPTVTPTGNHEYSFKRSWEDEE